MKVKTSVTLSSELIREVDALAGKNGSRSAVIESAVRELVAARTRRERDARDLAILNGQTAMRDEVEDALDYQDEP